jgi:hypothetical protein
MMMMWLSFLACGGGWVTGQIWGEGNLCVGNLRASYLRHLFRVGNWNPQVSTSEKCDANETFSHHPTDLP